MAIKPNQLGTYHMAQNSDYEPQRTNNFEVQITGLTNLTTPDRGLPVAANASTLITLSVASYSAPQINISQISVSYGNNKVKFAGVPDFPDSRIVLNDFIGMNTEKILSSWQKLAYDVKTQKIGKAVDYKKDAYLIEYAPDGSQPRQWKLVGCWCSELQLGEFSQDNPNVRQISCTLTYDHCIPLDI